MPRTSRCGWPRRCSTRALRTTSAVESEAALAAYDDLVARFRRQRCTLELQVPVAQGAVQQGLYARTTGRVRGRVDQPTTISSRGFGDSDAHWSSRCRLPRHCSTGASPTTSVASPRRNWQPTTISSRGFGASDAPDLQVQVARALLNKGVAHGWRDESEAELATYDDLVARFGASDAPDLQVAVARALFSKGVAHGRRDESEAELASLRRSGRAVSAPATPRNFRCRFPRHCSTRGIDKSRSAHAEGRSAVPARNLIVGSARPSLTTSSSALCVPGGGRQSG